jgi:hypothetical protein
MRIMNGFTYDAETAELTEEECAVFGRLVGDLCHASGQRELSVYLSAVTRPQKEQIVGLAERAAGRMWRERARL